VTANQSARPPTIAASANALTKPKAGQVSSSASAARKIPAIATSIPVAMIRMPRTPP
jgi:hypothetical protein